jgi:acyl-CoA thioester hydrolase
MSVDPSTERFELAIQVLIDYLNPARLGDEIVGRTWVGAARKHIFERYVEIVRVRDQKVLARARSLWCPIDLRSRRLTRVGAEIYQRFSVSSDRS